jgi:hypothetical protein
MEESHVEGLANHNDPESGAGGREDTGEAVTGAQAGGVWSRENLVSGCRRCSSVRKAARACAVWQVHD